MGDERREYCTHTHGLGGVHTCFPATSTSRVLGQVLGIGR